MSPDLPPEAAAGIRQIIETAGNLPAADRAELRARLDKEFARLDREEHAARKAALQQQVVFIRNEQDPPA